MAKEKNLKVVITAGGDGTRLGDLNPTKQPKSLLLFEGKPLISYQLKSLEQLGITDVFLSFNNEKQLEAFKKYQIEGFFPDLNYSFGFHNPFNHPHCLFRLKDVKEFISNSSFILTLGDLLVKDNLFKELLNLYNQTSSTIIIKEEARKTDDFRFITDEKSILVDIKKERPNWRYGGIYIIDKDELPEWILMAEILDIKTMTFFNLCLRNGKSIYVLDNDLNSCININTPNDFRSAQEYLKKLSSVVLK